MASEGGEDAEQILEAAKDFIQRDALFQNQILWRYKRSEDGQVETDAHVAPIRQVALGGVFYETSQVGELLPCSSNTYPSTQGKQHSIGQVV